MDDVHCRDAPKIDIDQLDLPENHPFAVKKKVSSCIALAQTCLGNLQHLALSRYSCPEVASRVELHVKTGKVHAKGVLC